MISPEEYFHLGLTIVQLTVLPAAVFIFKWVGRSLIRELNETIDSRASVIAKKTADVARQDYENLSNQIKQHDRMFADIKERLDLLVHRTAS